MSYAKSLSRFLAAGVYVPSTAPSRLRGGIVAHDAAISQTDLAAHDRRFHPDGFDPETDTCGLRADLASKDSPDTAVSGASAAKPKIDDTAYLDAVKRGDMETAARMVREAAAKYGYIADSSYQGTSAFNGAAPSANGYYESKEERKSAWEDGSFEDTQTLGDYIFDGIDIGDLERRLDNRHWSNARPEHKEAIENINSVISAKGKTIRMYRSVPSDVNEGSFRNGDWITPSRSYAVENAQIHGWGKKFRIIEQEVSVEDIWWDGNDIAEWGFDDGRESAYRNTKNNRKLLSPVTYDDAGDVIPLSRRFDLTNPDIRY